VIGPELKDLRRNNDEIAEVRGRHVARKDDGIEKKWNGRGDKTRTNRWY
jgi:hypothetical protein